MKKDESRPFAERIPMLIQGDSKETIVSFEQRLYDAREFLPFLEDEIADIVGAPLPNTVPFTGKIRDESRERFSLFFCAAWCLGSIQTAIRTNDTKQVCILSIQLGKIMQFLSMVPFEKACDTGGKWLLIGDKGRKSRRQNAAERKKEVRALFKEWDKDRQNEETKVWIAEMAETFDVSERTIYRDLEGK